MSYRTPEIISLLEQILAELKTFNELKRKGDKTCDQMIDELTGTMNQLTGRGNDK